MNSIPVIGTAIVNGPHWLKRLIESVDYPVDNFVIFDNNGRGQIAQELDNIAKITYQFIENVTVCHLPANIGCPGAWNMIIKCYMNAPYWIMSSHDVSFAPGFLEAMVQKSQDPEVGVVNSTSGEWGVGAWDLFLIKDWVVQKYGLFDENLYPGYNEDIDYWFRIKNDPMKRADMDDHVHYHGETPDYYATGRQTAKGEPEISEKLEQVNLTNFEYMEKKWGPYWRTSCPFSTPFNILNVPLSMTTYDLEFVRKKYLGF
jgi:hypothetical protein